LLDRIKKTIRSFTKGEGGETAPAPEPSDGESEAANVPENPSGDKDAEKGERVERRYWRRSRKEGARPSTSEKRVDLYERNYQEDESPECAESEPAEGKQERAKPQRKRRRRGGRNRGREKPDGDKAQDEADTDTENEGTSEPQAKKKKKKAVEPPPEPPPLIKVAEAEGKTRFTDLDIAAEVLHGIQDLGFEYCTPIQELSLPHLLAGKDLTGKAQTGTGKTAAFLTASLSYLKRNPPPEDRAPGSCRVLVLAPTRELAIQIYKDAEALSKYCGLNHHVVYGGMGHQAQRDALDDPVDILVGTPGRIIDYSRSRHLKLGKTEILVIDEADRMLDMGFMPDVRRIVTQTPRPGKRHTMLYSATLTGDIAGVIERWLVDPVTVESEPDEMVTDLIAQRFFTVTTEEKFALLLWLLKQETTGRTLVFCNRKDTTFRVSRKLQSYGVDCGLLSGDIPQDRRLKILERFREGEIQVVVATDVAARGIHVDDVTHVVNYDLPYETEDYVHRIGRTGRAGAQGESISMVCEYGAYGIPDLEKAIGIEVSCEYPDDEMVTLPPRPEGAPEFKEERPRRNNGGGGGRGRGGGGGGRGRGGGGRGRSGGRGGGARRR
jgi:ATP-dependent RNA helicase RhlB